MGEGRNYEDWREEEDGDAIFAREDAGSVDQGRALEIRGR